VRVPERAEGAGLDGDRSPSRRRSWRRPAPVRSALEPLGLADFRRLGAAYVLNELGNWLGEVALALVVYDRTGSALATAGLFLCSRFLPAFVGPALVARLQHLAPRRSLPALYVAEAAVFGVLAALAGSFTLPAFLALTAVDGVLAIAARALTRTATVATLEPHGHLRAGNALLNVGFTGIAALGPALAGLLIAWLGARWALVVDAGSFAFAALLLAFVRGGHEAEEAPPHWRTRLREGLGYVASSVPVRTLLAGQGVALVFFAAVVPIEVVLVKDVLGAGDAGYGALLASWGAGMALGGLVFAAARSVSLPVTIVATTAAIGAAYLGIGASPTLLAACLWSVVGGLGNGAQWVSVLTALQTATRRDMQPAVMSLFEALSSLMPGLGFIVGGVAASLGSPRLSFVIAGAGVLVVVVVGAGAASLQRRGRGA
jgi:MFS family permease